MVQNNKIIAIALIVAITSISIHATESSFKKYAVRSGKVTYAIKGQGEIMGTTQKLVGKKRLIFDKYGYRELNEEATVQKMNIFGNEKVDKSHKMSLRNGTRASQVNFKRKQIMEIEVPGIAWVTAASGQDLSQMGEKMLKQMGGKKIGTETIAGYTCDVWKMRVATQCLYKGVPLKVITNLMGVKRTEVATEAHFDVDIDESSYRLPNFTKTKLPQSSANGAMDAEAMSRAMAQLQKRKAEYEQIKRQQGVESGKAMTPQQRNSVTQAMGNSMFAQMKQKIISQEKAMKSIRGCLADSRTLKEANRCEKSFSKQTGEPSDPMTEWSTKIKQKILQDIDKGLASMKCIRKAKTMQEMRGCSME